MAQKPSSASSGQSIPMSRKIDEAFRQFMKLIQQRNPFKTRSYDRFAKDIEEYREVAEQNNLDLDTAKVFEIGCGQRPYRLFYLVAHGIDARAIDMDRVVFSMGISDFLQSMRENGFERTIKTLFRYYIFDIAENRGFRKFLSGVQGNQFDWPIERIVRGDATKIENWPEGKLDLIYSEDVFEHIPKDTLDIMCAKMADKMSGEGIAIIRPMVFTGIQGGHNVEYYNLDPSVKRNCSPWDHLREHNYPANTYLNRMTLADYRSLFAKHFEILDETVRDPDRGRVFMTEEIREELASWSEEELFSNHIRFILKVRKGR